jgi:hypothetical protein
MQLEIKMMFLSAVPTVSISICWLIQSCGIISADLLRVVRVEFFGLVSGRKYSNAIRAGMACCVRGLFIAGLHAAGQFQCENALRIYPLPATITFYR